MGSSPPNSKRRIPRWFCGWLKFLSLYCSGRVSIVAVRMTVQENWALPHQRKVCGIIYEGSIDMGCCDWCVSDTGFSERLHDGNNRFCGWRCVWIPWKEDWPEGLSEGVSGLVTHRKGNRAFASVPDGRCVSVLQAEVYAIVDHFRMVKEEDRHRANTNIAIWPNSQATIKAIKAPRRISWLVWKC